MFLGHFGLSFGAKTAQPRVSLGTLFLAAQFADLLWPNLLLLGIEKVRVVPGLMTVSAFDFVHYPFSHSLAMDVFWGLLLGLGYWLLRRNTGGALLVGLLVPSHWLLDLLVHRPDLPLFPGASPLFGLGLWNSMVATQLAEALFFFGGLYLYLRRTVARNRRGRYGIWGLVVPAAVHPRQRPVQPGAHQHGCHWLGLPAAVAARAAGLLGRPAPGGTG